jgi:hypothetical protein
MLIAQVVIEPADNPDAICDIGLSGGHHIQKASDHRSEYSRIAGFFVGLSLVKLHRHWHGNWAGLIHSDFPQYYSNVAVLMDVDRVMLPNAFDVHARIPGDTPEIMHPEPLLHVVIDQPNQAQVSNDKEIIDLRNDCDDDYFMIHLVMEQEQSSFDK